MSRIQACIGYSFNNIELLVAAFTHSSYVNEHNAIGNGRMEFLGDCVLNFLVGEMQYSRDSTADKGRLSKRRAAIVSREPLARIVDELGLLRYLRVGAGVDVSSFEVKTRSNLFEALLGAVYLDGGIDTCKRILDRIYYPRVRPVRDYKSELQVYAAERNIAVEYVTTENGNGYRSVVTVDGKQYVGIAIGKKAAEIAAAREAVQALRI